MLPFQSLQEFLLFLANGGAVIAVLAVFGYFESWALQNLKWFVNLPAEAKSIIMLVLALAVGFAAKYALQFDLAGLEAWFQVAFLTVVSWLSTQKAYRAIKGEGYGAIKGK